MSSRMTVSIFLGAGASSAFGYPTTKDFKEILVTELQQKFKDNGNLSSEEKILLTTLMHQPHMDIEYIFEFWKRLKQLQDKPEFSIIPRFFNSYQWGGQIKGVPNPGYDQGAELKNYFDYGDFLMQFLTDRLYKVYSSKEANIETARQIYTPLFEALKTDPLHIFTTNYDTVIEQYAIEEHYDLIDGFQFDPNSGFMIWKPLLFQIKNSSSRSIVLYKLHGSLNWKKHKNYGIVKLPGVEKIMDDDWQYTADLLIRPTLSPKEEEGDEPYKLLLSKFVEKIHDTEICLIIGYSFRDKRINEIFYEHLKSGKSLIVVSPTSRNDFDNAFNSILNSNNYSNCILIEKKMNLENIADLIKEINEKL